MWKQSLLHFDHWKLEDQNRKIQIRKLFWEIGLVPLIYFIFNFRSIYDRLSYWNMCIEKIVDVCITYIGQNVVEADCRFNECKITQPTL